MSSTSVSSGFAHWFTGDKAIRKARFSRFAWSGIPCPVRRVASMGLVALGLVGRWRFRQTLP
jgi:hypothetical protein